MDNESRWDYLARICARRYACAYRKMRGGNRGRMGDSLQIFAPNKWKREGQVGEETE